MIPHPDLHRALQALYSNLESERPKGYFGVNDAGD